MLSASLSMLIFLGTSTLGQVSDPPAVGPLVVHPQKVVIRHHRHPFAVQVLGSSKDGFSLDLRSQAQFTSADPKVAIVDGQGWIVPRGSGQTQVTVAVAGQEHRIAVEVQLPVEEPAISFRHEVMPVLTRAGCNMGGCHGYSLGKNGFKLSLRGQDPEPDYFQVARDHASRRIDFQNSKASLLLGKATGQVPHEGGMRFGRDTLSYQILHTWIEQGVPGDLKDPAEVVAVRLVPDKLVLRPGQKHRLQLIARYQDGSERDVTRLGVFNANNTQYGNVEEDGLVTAGDAGETAIVARFERTFAATSVLVLPSDRTFTPTPVPQNHVVDRHVIDKLNRLKVSPSELAGDEEFLRRLYLDLIGLQPRPDEIRAFLADKSTDKREKVLAALFQRPEYVDHWSLKWGDLLQNSRNSASPQGVYLFREFIRGAVAANMPLDEFARRLLTARGGSVDDPASVYLAISKDTNETVERVTQVFCGVRMLCARCHSHPAENWTQADYFGLATFFNQVGTRPDTRQAGKQTKDQLVILNLKAGATTNPRTGKPQPPRYLGGQDLTLQTDQDRREAYAAWLTSPKNPFFARGMVNRIWSYFFHRGIIEPVDDIRSTNPPINPALLDALTEDFVQNRFDLRHLLRTIVTSATYQRSSTPNESNRYEEQNFSRAIPRRIPAEALLDSLVQATAIPEVFGGAPAGFRAAQLPDGNVDNAFLKLFGKPQRMDACECERDNGSNMLQALHFINGKSTLSRLQNPAARPALLLKLKLSDEDQVKEMYLWSLARHPNAEEMRVSVEFLNSYPNRGEALQDLQWALVNSKDFLLVH